MKTYLIAFLDLLLCMLMVVFLMVHPQQDPQDALEPPGKMLIYTTWSGVAGDVDTWMLAPNMPMPIGYDRKDSEVCNLVKDDLGTDYQPGEPNYENIFCRSTPDGEYIVNVHAYGIKVQPVEVNVQVALTIDGVTKLLFEEKVTLQNPKDEITVIRFKLKDGQVVPGSVHHTFISLYK